MRLAFKARRQAMSEEECKMRANALCKRIVESEAYQKAQSVMAYLAMPKEANLDALVTQALADGKTVYVPVCVSKTEMVAARLRRLDDVKTGVLHIRIPNEPYECAAPTDLDLILVPGVAFDTKGDAWGWEPVIMIGFWRRLPGNAYGALLGIYKLCLIQFLWKYMINDSAV